MKKLLIVSGVIVSLFVIHSMGKDPVFHEETSTLSQSAGGREGKNINERAKALSEIWAKKQAENGRTQGAKEQEAEWVDGYRSAIREMIDGSFVLYWQIDPKNMSKESFTDALGIAAASARSPDISELATNTGITVARFMASAIYENPKLDKEALLDVIVEFAKVVRLTS